MPRTQQIYPDGSIPVSAGSLAMGRRDFLKTAAGLCLSPLVAQAAPQDAAVESQPPLQLAARAGTAKLIDGGQTATRIWGYNGAVPGPLLRVKRNQSVRVRLTNQLPQPTSVHWHGLRIDNDMDGVAGLTQEAVQPGQSFDYEFRPRMRAPSGTTLTPDPGNR